MRFLFLFALLGAVSEVGGGVHTERAHSEPHRVSTQSESLSHRGADPECHRCASCARCALSESLSGSAQPFPADYALHGRGGLPERLQREQCELRGLCAYSAQRRLVEQYAAHTACMPPADNGTTCAACSLSLTHSLSLLVRALSRSLARSPPIPYFSRLHSGAARRRTVHGSRTDGCHRNASASKTAQMCGVEMPPWTSAECAAGMAPPVRQRQRERDRKRQRETQRERDTHRRLAQTTQGKAHLSCQAQRRQAISLPCCLCTKYPLVRMLMSCTVSRRCWLQLGSASEH